MVDPYQIKQLLPPPIFQKKRIIGNQDVNDIVNEVLTVHRLYAADYKKFAYLFDGPDEHELFQNLFDFLKSNVVYEVETDANQSSKSPARLLADAKGDCKHYANFIAGVLSALGYDVTFRFASYNVFDKKPAHVFVVVHDQDGNEIWIDPVLSSLDKRFPVPVFIKDVTFEKKAMALNRLSGVGATVEQAYIDAYGNEITPYDRPNVGEQTKGVWDVIKDVAGGILTVVLGSGQTGTQQCYCPPNQPNPVNPVALVGAAGAGLLIALLIKKL